MFGLPILEVAIGLCFVYLLLSLICSTVNEAIAGITGRGGDMLAQAISNLLGDTNLRDKLYAHPLIKSLSQSATKVRPSYIPATKFSLALLDVLKQEDPAAHPHLQKAMGAILADARTHLSTDQHKIEAWYEDAMDRVSGWYKRKTTLWIWALAALVTLFTNADTLRMGKTLWVNQAVRSAVVDAAQARVQTEQKEGPTPLVEYDNPDNPQSSTPTVKQQEEALTPQERQLLGSLLMGWRQDLSELDQTQDKYIWWGSHLLGWFFTVVALSLGAPFWFDMLSKFINLRNGGKVPQRISDPPQQQQQPQNPAQGAGA